MLSTETGPPKQTCEKRILDKWSVRCQGNMEVVISGLKLEIKDLRHWIETCFQSQSQGNISKYAYEKRLENIQLQ